MFNDIDNCQAGHLIKVRRDGRYNLMVHNKVVPSIIIPKFALTNVTDLSKWLYDLDAPAPGDNARNDQGNVQVDEMEQGDSEQQAPPENLASTSTRSRRRRERQSASNDDVMDAIMEQDERMQSM